MPYQIMHRKRGEQFERIAENIDFWPKDVPKDYTAILAMQLVIIYRDEWGEEWGQPFVYNLPPMEWHSREQL